MAGDQTAHKAQSRKQRLRDMYREEILVAAERVFVAKGYAAATIEEIAREAEVAIGTIYNFFRGKEELYDCFVERMAQEVMQTFETEVLPLEDPREAIRQLIKLRLAHFEQHYSFFQAIFQAEMGYRIDPGRMMPPVVREIYDRYIAHLAGIFQRGIDQGLFEPVDTLYYTLGLEGVITAFVAHWARVRSTEPLAVRAERLCNVVLERIRVMK